MAIMLSDIVHSSAKLSTMIKHQRVIKVSLKDRSCLLVNKKMPLAPRVSTLNVKETDDRHGLFDRPNRMQTRELP